MVWPCKKKASGKISKQALLAKANEKKKTVGRPKTTIDESILHRGSWVELLGTSPKQNDGGDGIVWSVAASSRAAAPAILTGKRTMKRKRIFHEVFNGFVCFFTVCSVKVAFIQSFHFIYQLLYFLNYF